MIVAALSGCASLSVIAPPVESLGPSSSDRAALMRGREVYLTSCIGCHQPYPVGDYTAADWDAILPDMNGRAKLAAADAAALRAYLDAAGGLR